jgi:hypothetical protein
MFSVKKAPAWKKYCLPYGIVEAKVHLLNPRWGRLHLKLLFRRWLKLDRSLKKFGGRGMVLPEYVSEGAFCCAFPDSVRVSAVKGQRCSYDCLDTKTGARIQVKASSIVADCTSFGPRSEWDLLYYMDCSRTNGEFHIYEINTALMAGVMVNKNETSADQREQGRRPRFSIVKKFIRPLGLEPCKVITL